MKDPCIGQRWMGWGLAAALLCGSAAMADNVPYDAKKEIDDLKAEVARLRAAQGETWLNERRAEEVKMLIREVLEDADTRASLAGDGMTAGHNGKNFFLASGDGNFLLNIEGQIQFRYIFNDNDNEDDEDDNEGGFQARRTKIGFFGHIVDPKLQYKIKGAFDRGDGDFVLEEAYAKYDYSDNMFVQVGQFKGGFLREEWVSSSKQQAVERSDVNEFFTLDYTQGIMFGFNIGDNIRVYTTVYDGREMDNVDFHLDTTDIGGAARAEWLIFGDWKQFGDMVAFSGTPTGLLAGIGFDWEEIEGGSDSPANDIEDFYQWTIDLSFQANPFSAFVAVIGRNLNTDSAAAEVPNDINQVGWVAQAGVFLVPDKWDIFVRYEHLDVDGFDEITAVTLPTEFGMGIDETQVIWTFGTNYYFHKHASKASLDFLWAPDGILIGETGAGTLDSVDEDEDQYVIRAQYQLLF